MLSNLSCFVCIRQSRSDDVRGSPRLTVTSMFVALNIVGMHALCFIISSESSQVSLHVKSCELHDVRVPAAVWPSDL